MNFQRKNLIELLKGCSLSAAAALIVGIGGYVIRLLLAARFSKENYAAFYALMAAGTLIVTLGRVGCPDVLLFIISRSANPARDPAAAGLFAGVCKVTFRIFAVLTLIAALLILPGRQLPGFNLSPVTLLIFLPFLLLSAFEGVYNNLFNALKAFDIQYELQIMKTFLMVVMLYLLVRPDGIDAAVISFNVPILILCLTATAIVKKKFPYLRNRQPEWKLIRRQIPCFFYLYLLSFSGVIFNELGTLFLSLFSTPQEVADFNVAVPTAMIIRSFYGVGMVLVPIMGEMINRDDFRQIRRYTLIISSAVILAGIILIPFFFFLGEWAITLLFGRQYASTAPAAFFLSEAILLGFAGQINVNTLNTLKEERTSAFLMMGIAVLALIVYFPAAKYGGARWISGCAMGIAIVWGIVSFGLVERKLKQYTAAE